jgi:hypothetical protein
MKNFDELDSEGLQEIGEQVVNICNLLAKQFYEHGRRHNVLHRQLLDFEITDGKRKQWMQAKISVNSDPLQFNTKQETECGYVPYQLGEEIAGEFAIMLYKMLDYCQDHKVPANIAHELVTLCEEHILKVSNLIGDTNIQTKK